MKHEKVLSTTMDFADNYIYHLWKKCHWIRHEVFYPNYNPLERDKQLVWVFFKFIAYHYLHPFLGHYIVGYA